MYCVATIQDNGEDYLSVMIPPTEGYSDPDGYPMAVWNIGNVAPGGVADSFYSEKGPGAFMVRNTGTLPAYVYVTAGDLWSMSMYGSTKDYRVSESARSSHDSVLFEEVLESLGADGGEISPTRPGMDRDRDRYCGYVAVSTKVTGKVPEWRPLCWMYYPGSSPYSPNPYDSPDGQAFASWRNCCEGENGLGVGPCGQFLAHMRAGETQLFDLKFWAPTETYTGNCKLGFIVRVEASGFRRWDHDVVGQ